MSGATPGPWRPELHHTKRDGGRLYGFVHSANNLVPVAAIPLGVEGYGYDEGAANTHLIAAAPDGYAFGEVAVKGLRIMRDELRAAGGEPMPTVDAAISMGEAFLAKARGEKS